MSISKISSDPNIEINDSHESSKKEIKLQEIQTNINKELGTNFITSLFNKIFRPKRTVALQQLRENLKCNKPKQSWFSSDLPQSTQKLFNEYLALFAEDTMSQEEFQAIWDGKNPKAIGTGGFGTVYQSADGKYALKVPNSGKSIGEDRTKNEALIENMGVFDPTQLYYVKNDGFITQYAGTFVTQDGIEVAVFEKIDGQDFDKCNAVSPAQQCRLLAQAATAIAISHEAGCINSDIKPGNMMVSEDFSLLKLIDQGAVINLTEGITNVSSYTPYYASPEVPDSHIHHNLVIADMPDVEEKSVSPAIDVYSLGVTILQKLSTMNGASDEIKQLRKLFETNPMKALEDIGESKNLFGTPEESKFVGQLLRDCLAVKPEDRISAAQVAEILQVFSSYLEEKGTKPDIECPNYDTVKEMAIEDCPKGIPIALRKMLFHSDTKIQQKAISTIEKLVGADPSYKNTPSYGMVLLLQSNEAFSAWAKEYPAALKQLKDRTYILGQEYPDKDMPVSKKAYNRIQAFELSN